MKVSRITGFCNRGNGFRVFRFLSIALTLGLFMLSLTGCSGTKPETEVADTAITQSPENVARVFAESVFCGDYELMLKCFPSVYSDSLSETDISKYTDWSEQTKTALEKSGTKYLGTSSAESKVISADKTSAEYLDSLASVSLSYGIASTDITDIRSCAVRVFCTIDSSSQYQDVTMIVYKYNSDWYACVNADSGAG